MISVRASAHLDSLRSHPRTEHAAYRAMADNTTRSNHQEWREIASFLLTQACAHVDTIPWSDDVGADPAVTVKYSRW